MCGWSGVWVTGETRRGDVETDVVAMTRTLGHRGPDDEGYWSDTAAGIGLGFRRLAIQDLSQAGHQPMLSRHGRFVVVFNGEIYNFQQLRRELSWAGATFRGGSDTEVLLAAVEVWGLQKAVRRFEGMFAFALWDRYDRILHLARDRMGEKPLYYGVAGGALLFGSELKALREYPGWSPEVDRGSLTLFLRYGAVPHPYSIYKGIRQMPPGHILSIPAPGVPPSPNPYWQLKDVAEAAVNRRFRGTEDEALDGLEHVVGKAVESRMIADVPLGAFLSGGVDSSLVTAMMQTRSQRPVRTFSIGFEEPRFNEAAHAKAVAMHLGTEHTELIVTARDALAVVPELPSIYDEPFADASGIPTTLLSRLARQHVTVCLSGDGGDELFGGYTRHRITEKIWSKMCWVPRGLRHGIGLGMNLSGTRMRHLADVVTAKSREALYRRMISHWKMPASAVLGGSEPDTEMTDGSRWPEGIGFREWMMYCDAACYMPWNVLTKVDRASMAVALEVRIPLLDRSVVEYAWNLPVGLKVRGGTGKWILRRLLYRHVPAELVDRPKMGFGVPIGPWLRGPLRLWAEDLLSERRLRQGSFFNVAEVRSRWCQHLAGKGRWEHCLWNILMFEAWRDRWL